MPVTVWLVVWNHLKNISQLGWLFPIYGKIKNVPNHQPAVVTVVTDHCSLSFVSGLQSGAASWYPVSRKWVGDTSMPWILQWTPVDTLGHGLAWNSWSLNVININMTHRITSGGTIWQVPYIWHHLTYCIYDNMKHVTRCDDMVWFMRWNAMLSKSILQESLNMFYNCSKNSGCCIQYVQPFSPWHYALALLRLQARNALDLQPSIQTLGDIQELLCPRLSARTRSQKLVSESKWQDMTGHDSADRTKLI